ncbi:MAG: thioesterase family protein [Alphaproteobacteria bacterium]|nr:thioesterase family protein [Alphaproteobacteria bacterium]
MTQPPFDPRLFAVHTGRVLPEWIDVNRHMNLAYYLLAFDHGTDAFLNHHGIGSAYTLATGGGFFVLETHLTYEREMLEGEEFRIVTQILGFDAKRLHFFHAMHHAEKGFLAATNELMALHVDLAARRSAPWPETATASLAPMAELHGRVPRPPQAGRSITMERRRAA